MSYGVALATDLFICLIILPIALCGISFIISRFPYNPRNDKQKILCIVTISLYLIELIFILIIVSILGFTHTKANDNNVYYWQTFHQFIHFLVSFCQFIRFLSVYFRVKFNQTLINEAPQQILNKSDENEHEGYRTQLWHLFLTQKESMDIDIDKFNLNKAEKWYWYNYPIFLDIEFYMKYVAIPFGIFIFILILIQLFVHEVIIISLCIMTLLFIINVTLYMITPKYKDTMGYESELRSSFGYMIFIAIGWAIFYASIMTEIYINEWIEIGYLLYSICVFFIILVMLYYALFYLGSSTTFNMRGIASYDWSPRHDDSPSTHSSLQLTWCKAVFKDCQLNFFLAFIEISQWLEYLYIKSKNDGEYGWKEIYTTGVRTKHRDYHKPESWIVHNEKIDKQITALLVPGYVRQLVDGQQDIFIPTDIFKLCTEYVLSDDDDAPILLLKYKSRMLYDKYMRSKSRFYIELKESDARAIHRYCYGQSQHWFTPKEVSFAYSKVWHTCYRQLYGTVMRRRK